MEKERNNILLIEDNIDHVDLIKLALRNNRNLNICISGTLEDAQKHIDQEAYNLIISDIKLPDGDSVEHFNLKNIFNTHYVIVMTSFGDEQRAVNALKSGARDYLVKDTPLFQNISNIVDRALREINSINEKRKVETELKKSEEKYRKLFESASDGIFVMEEDRFIECNEKILEIFALQKKEDFIGKKPYDLSPTEQYDAQNSLSLGKRIIQETAKKREVKRFYWKHIKADGTPFDAEVSLNPFEMEGKMYFHGTIKDITERIKAVEQLRTWENIFRHAQWGIVVTENSGKKISMLNAAFALMLRYNEAELHYSSLSKLFPSKINSIADVIIEKTKRNNYFTTETTFNRKNGESFPVLVNSFVIRDASNMPVNFVLNVQDITERKHTEKLEREVELAKRSSKMKQQFLANMSHEIRTPLNSILGFVELLKETSIDNIQKDYLSLVDESSNILLNLINDILDFSKIEAGKLTLYKKSVNICNTFKKVHSFFELPAKTKGLAFSVTCPRGEAFYVKIDETRLLQVVSNLVSNAIKFTKEGEVGVEIKLMKIVKNIAYFRVEVIDTGVGISDENQKRLFKVFSQLDREYERIVQGTGLGLAISKQIVDLMGGDIGVNSSTESGSTFWFTFAAEKSEIEVTEIVEKNNYDLKNLDLNLKVLLAEDKVLNQKMASIMIANAGCKVDIANDGLEVLELFEEEKYDIIFMDIQMPNMDGISAMKKLKEEYKKVPPIIGLSASAMEGDAERFKKEGMDDYLSKPVQAESIYEKLIIWGLHKG